MIQELPRDIDDIARQMRLIQAEMSLAFPCYIGSSLSVTDIMATLYFSIMNINMQDPDDPDRDILVLSKGHSSPAMYSALCLRGGIDRELLLKHSTLDSPVYYHPSSKLPFVELSTGSLGQGLNFGLGTATAQIMDKRTSRTFVILGDGELNEGSNWEAIMSAPAFKVGNLTAIVDRNGRQANQRTEDLVPLNDLEAKWKAFGWRTEVVDGHDTKQLEAALNKSGESKDTPLAIIAKTVRGKGVSFLEDRKEAWLWQLSGDEYAKAVKEINGDTDAADQQINVTGSGSLE